MFVRPSIGPIAGKGGYGLRQLPNEPVTKHSGIDFVGAMGSPIRAVRSGVVVLAAPNGTLQRYGNVVVIQHDDPSFAPYSLYAHMSRLRARKGQRVLAGQIIGYMGNLAATRDNPNKTVATHLHFELVKRFPLPPPDVDRVDPTPLINTAYIARGGGRVPVLYPPSAAQSNTYAGAPALYPGIAPGAGPLLYSRSTPFADVDVSGNKVLWAFGLAALAWALLPHGGQESW